MLDGEVVLICGPMHARDVIVARGAGDLHPASGAAGDVHHANAHGGIRGSGNWVGDIDDRRIAAETGIRKPSYYFAWGTEIVNEEKNLHAGSVKLPIGDVTAVRAPAKAVADVQLLFVNPVGSAID